MDPHNQSHRFTLQGPNEDPQQLVDTQKLEFKGSDLREMSLQEIYESEQKMISSMRSSAQKQKQMATIETENMFQPIGQFTDYDLAQYNSPSFATAS